VTQGSRRQVFLRYTVYRFYLATLVGVSLLFSALDSGAAQPQFLILTASGGNSFYASPGDTVSVQVRVDSDSERMTGVEIFLGVDRRIFQVLEASVGSPPQPVDAPGLLGDVLVNTLLEEADTLAIIHYAETDLSGRAVAGVLFGFRLRVLGRHSGQSPISVHRDTANQRISMFSVPNPDGATQELTGVAPLYFVDAPPVLVLADSIWIDEDKELTLRLDTLVVDEEPADSIVWQASTLDSLTQLQVSSTYPTALSFSPGPDYYGELRLRLSATDPAGASTVGEIPVRVRPVNDPPEILPGAVPDTLVLADRSMSVSLSGAAVDVDDPDELLAWTGLALDPVSIAVEGSQVVLSAPGSWTGIETVTLRVSDPAGRTDSVVVAVVRLEPLTSVPGDFDGDDRVDFSDFLRFATHYGSRSDDTGFDSAFDLNDDLRVDFLDFLVLAKAFGGSG
jgi:hypothetical protein